MKRVSLCPSPSAFALLPLPFCLCPSAFALLPLPFSLFPFPFQSLLGHERHPCPRERQSDSRRTVVGLCAGEARETCAAGSARRAAAAGRPAASGGHDAV